MDIAFRKFQQGGALPQDQSSAGQAASAEPAADTTPADPVMQLAQMAVQALQAGDCNMMAQVCQGFLQLIQSAQGDVAPAPEQTEPVYKKGGVLVRRIKK